MSEVHKVCVRFHTAIELLGGRWTGAVLRALVTGSHRFADIKAAARNLSDTMLWQSLRELAAAGLCDRRVMATSPGARRVSAHPDGPRCQPDPRRGHRLVPSM